MELKETIEGLGKAWADFQAADRDTKSRNEAERKELLEKVNAAVDAAEAAKKRADEASQKANRIAAAGGDAGKPGNEAKAEHKKAFGAFLRKGVETGLKDIEVKALSLGVAADGGFALPEEIASQVQQRLLDISPMRSAATVVQVSTSDYKRLLDVRGAASGWVGETAVRPVTNTPQLFEAAASMGEVYANAVASQQSLDDMFFDAEAWLASSIGDEFARAEGAAFLTGDGTNKPKGFLTYTTAATDDGARAFGTLQRVNTGVAGDFAASNKGDILLTAIYKLKAGHRTGAAWMMSKALLGEVRGFKDTTGQYLWAPGLAAGQPSTLLGYPVVEAEDMPAKAASSLSIAFGNFRAGYCVVDRVGIRTLRDPYTNKPNINFYATKRVGGMLLDSEAIKLVQFAV
jgi:HK97 family phage major capsid protein